MTESTKSYTDGKVMVTALYKFTSFANFTDYREKILNTMQTQGVKGTLLITI